MTKPRQLAAIAAALVLLAGCKTAEDGTAGTMDDGATVEGSGTVDDGGASVDGGTTVDDGGTNTGDTADTDGTPSIPTLINVNLQNVLNDLSISLEVDRNSIPVTAQVPIDVAAAVCGVSVSALAASLASGNGSCTATTTSGELTQVVQQQISTGGDVEGGDQTTTVPDGS